MNAERLLFDLIGGGLSSGGRGRKRYRFRPGRGLGDAVGRTVLSPQGLTILGGLAVAAYEHFKGAKDGNPGGPAGAPLPAGPGTGVPSAVPLASGTSSPAGAPSSSPASPLPPPFIPPARAGGPATAAPRPIAKGMPDGEVIAAGDANAPAGEARARLLIRAMVSAAQADGAIDPEERRRILGQLAERGTGDAERAFLEREMALPVDLDRLVAEVRDPVLAAEVYTASLLAIDPDTPAEIAYLATLATRLNLEPGVITELETRLDAAD